MLGEFRGFGPALHCLARALRGRLSPALAIPLPSRCCCLPWLAAVDGPRDEHPAIRCTIACSHGHLDGRTLGNQPLTPHRHPLS